MNTVLPSLKSASARIALVPNATEAQTPSGRGEPHVQGNRAGFGSRRGNRAQLAEERTPDRQRPWLCRHLVHDAGGAEGESLASLKAADTEHSHRLEVPSGVTRETWAAGAQVDERASGDEDCRDSESVLDDLGGRRTCPSDRTRLPQPRCSDRSDRDRRPSKQASSPRPGWGRRVVLHPPRDTLRGTFIRPDRTPLECTRGRLRGIGGVPGRMRCDVHRVRERPRETRPPPLTVPPGQRRGVRRPERPGSRS
jgi:hypothetical protein